MGEFVNSITIRYWAAAKEAAGLTEETVQAETLADALDTVRERHADRVRFGPVLAMSSLLVDDQPVGKRDHASVTLRDGSQVEVLPPFAGG
ncbi:MoaD/ThiS family protein [Flindersiella endophytica]